MDERIEKQLEEFCKRVDNICKFYTNKKGDIEFERDEDMDDCARAIVEIARQYEEIFPDLKEE